MPPRRSRWSAPRVDPFPSEAALCETLRDASRALGWAFYPETGGWDALLVLGDEAQVGVQAKLRTNVDVLAQALVDSRRPGPDVHAVLVPACSRAFRDVAGALGIAVLSGSTLRGDAFDRGAYFRGTYPRGASYLEAVVSRAPRATHLRGRCWLPPFVPDGPAGVPAPRSVSPWRVAAAHLCAEIRAGLEPTSAQIRERGMSPSTWRRWLDPVSGTRPRRYRLRASASLPDVAFPDVVRGLGLPTPVRGAP